MIRTNEGSLKASAGRTFRTLASAVGSQSIEVAFSFPIVLALVLGVTNFSSAYRLKHTLNNAARETARFASAQSPLDLDCGSCSQTPASITSLRDVVANYLSNAQIGSCAINSTPTYSSSYRTWTFTSNTTGCSAFSMVIQRGYPVLQGKTNILATHVTITYPYTWSYSVSGLLNLVDKFQVHGQGQGTGGGSGPTSGTMPGQGGSEQMVLPNALTSDAYMQNLP